ncbi:MAG: retroviral-like aspartic protease family protein [Bacteroidetes bacterium]|nr:retroviral-like aspartic protease family protein [Bacteroidota bacterium]
MRMKIYLLLVISFTIAYTYAQSPIKMELTGGVYKIPCKVNGLNLKFIFDTGASDVSVSLTEALFMLKNDYLSESDFLGTEHYKIANGDIEEGTKINLKCIEVGGQKVYNVSASIVHSTDAPLLFGQSAMQKFGKFSIDYSAHILWLGGPKNNLIQPTQVVTQKSKPSFKVTDIDGNLYDTVKIGMQYWLKQNLATTHFNDGTPILQIESAIEWNEIFNSQSAISVYSHCMGEENMAPTYGYLYNWYATTDYRGICPTGWHIPSDAEFSRLAVILGGDAVAGGKLKSIALWQPPNSNASNSSGFSAIPAGYRFYDGDFVGIGKYASFWTSTQESKNGAWYCDVRYNESSIHHLPYSVYSGHSIRCIKD